jgi:hypothetical protein
MSIQDYYTKLQKGMICVGVHEETEDKICHFYFWLCTEIQDIIDYKEYNTINHLFELAMLAEKELQGHQPTKMKTSFMPRPASTTPSRTTMPSGAHSSTIPSASCVPSMSSIPSTTTPHAMGPSKTSVLQGAIALKPYSSTVSTSCTSDIKCHCCHDIGHF